MLASATCPYAGSLAALIQGEGSAEDVERAAEHVEQCQRCAEYVEQVLAQTQLFEPGRALPTAAERPDRSEIETLIGRLAPLARFLTAPGTTAAETDTPAELASTVEADDGAGSGDPVMERNQLGPYRLMRLLGQGGMGIVFLAEDEQLGRTVAVKVMRPDRCDAPARARFLREARAMASLRNEHVVTIYHVGEEGNVPYLVMEYLQGESLGDRLRHEERLSIPEVVRIGREVALGLAAAHERGLIHRDVKPDNIWLEAASGRVKLLDFGLARAGDDDTRLTHPGTVVGTPAYLSPEQARNEPLDGRSDLFALGCILYRACTGRLPFFGTSTLAVLTALAVDRPPDPRRLNPAVPRRLAELILRLLAKARQDRPASAAEVAAALDSIRQDREPGRDLRHWWPWAAALVAVVLIFAVVGRVFFRPAAGPSGGTGTGETTADSLTLMGTIDTPELREVSVLSKSRRHDGVFWTLTNAEGRLRLIAVERSGRVRGVVPVAGVDGITWPILAGDGNGCLYVADAGSRREPTDRRTIYRIPEPDLPAATVAAPVPVEAVYHYRPSSADFDLVAMFYHRGAMYLCDAGKDGQGPDRLYGLALDHPGETAGLDEICTLPAVVADVRAAALSPDGGRLAFCSDHQTVLFELRPTQPLKTLALWQPQVFAYPSRRMEGCAWDGADLLLADERGRIYRLGLQLRK